MVAKIADFFYINDFFYNNINLSDNIPKKERYIMLSKHELFVC